MEANTEIQTKIARTSLKNELDSWMIYCTACKWFILTIHVAVMALVIAFKMHSIHFSRPKWPHHISAYTQTECIRTLAVALFALICACACGGPNSPFSSAERCLVKRWLFIYEPTSPSIHFTLWIHRICAETYRDSLISKHVLCTRFFLSLAGPITWFLAVFSSMPFHIRVPTP